MTSSYRDPNVTAALAYQAEQEQRRKAQEQPSFIDVAGRTALGLGAAALAGAGIARGLRRNAMRPVTVEDLGATAARAEENVRRAARTTTAPPPSRPAPPAGAARQQAAEEFTRQARAERPVGVQQISIQDLGPTFRTPSPAENKATLAFLEDVVLPTEQALTRPRLPAASFSPADYLTQKGYVEAAATGTPYSLSEVAALARRPAVESAVDAGDRFIQEYEQLAENQARADRRVRAKLREREMQIRGAGERVLAELQQESLVSKQQARTGFNVDQAINALDAAEDQQTGRVKIQLQRNEDLDMGQVEVLEDIASQQRNWMMEQDEPINRVAVQLPDGLPVDQAENSGMAAQKFVSSELAKQRPSREPLLDIETKMYDLVATAAESGLKLEPKRALSILTNPGIELTTDEINLFNVNPEIGKFALKGQSFGPGQKQTGGSMSITGERLKSIPNIGLDPQSSITSAASGTSIRGRSRVQNQPDVFRQRVDSYGRPITEDVVNIDTGGTVTASPGEELTELDIPEEVTSTFTRFVKNPITGKTEQEYAPKGMRAISTKEGKTYYVPIQDPGGVGVYGEERSYASGPLIKYDMPEQERIAGAYTKAAMRKPTDMPFVEKAQGGAGFSSMDSNQLQSFVSNAPEGRVRQAGIQELNRRQVSQRSLEAAEAVRRANIEGRDPQDFLQNFEFKKAETMPQEPIATVPASFSTEESIYNLPMNFSYQGNAIPGTPSTTFEALQSGLRTSTLRKPGQVPSRVQPGTRITAIGPKGERQLLEVTGRQMVTPEMADQLSKVERWTPDFLRNYINKVGGGKLEQITYKTI